MMKKCISLGAAALLLASDVSAYRIQHLGWVQHHRADPASIIKISLPVKQKNLDQVERLFWQVSNPNSTLYGHHLSFAAIGELVKNEHSTHAVVKYLKSLGIATKNIHVNPHGTFVSVRMNVSVANEAFHADFHEYLHPLARNPIIKTELSLLPHELKAHVTYLPHVSYFPSIAQKVAFNPNLKINRRSVADAGTSSGQGYVTPDVLFQYYGVDNAVVANGATQSVFEALGQQFDNTDLEMFQTQNGLAVQDIVDIIGTNTPTDCFGANGPDNCGEANLDVQYMTAMAQAAETVYWSISAASNNPFVDWVEQLSQYSNLPMVHSISYGGYEAGSNMNDMDTFNTEVQKLGLQGISVLVSSGDDGAAGNAARNDAAQCGYFAQFPANSPYVTTVGATQGPESGETEVVCSSITGGVITSGGGFSDVYARPAYQDAQVNAYFANVDQAPVAGYNAQGRAYPDVSVMGFNYALAIGGQFTLESGTSASAPVFAGMITLINDARLAAGQPALGFLNQALYSLDPAVWMDVVTGDNRCTANPQVCCTEGFFAAAGWDPVTGLGTPDFLALKQALLAL